MQPFCKFHREQTSAKTNVPFSCLTIASRLCALTFSLKSNNLKMLPHSTWTFYAYSTSYRILQCKKHGLYEYHIQTVWVHSQTHRSAWDKIPPSAHMQNANIFLSATVPCYIAASLVIFIWILHLRFLPLSVCVIVSNTGRDLSPRSNRLPPPAARFWGLTLWDWSFYFCLVSAKRQGEKREGGVG